MSEISPSAIDPSAAHVNRIMGVEVEYGVVGHSSGGTPISPDDTARAMFKQVAATHGSSNIFTDNGSRLYLDVGAHPEWATAECTDIAQLISYEKAGDLMMRKLATRAEKLLGETRDTPHVCVLKNNVDNQGNSYGCHENYLLGRDVILKQFSAGFLPFLVTRQLLCGAGKIYHPFPPGTGDYEPGFCISQRADHVWESVSSATTRSRPIINTRDEPHADSSMWRRLHVIVGDSSMAEPTIALKMGSTILVLEMIEAGYPLHDLALEHDIRAIRDIARDPFGTVELSTHDGRSLSALDVQETIATMAAEWLSRRPDPAPGKGTTTATLTKILDLWFKVIGALRAQDLSPLERDIDWVIKRKVLTTYADKHGLELTSDRIRQLDFAYHDIRPGHGIYHMLVAKGLVNRWVTDADIDHALSTPPDTTRAVLRARFLEAARRRGAMHSVDWMRVKLSRPEPRVVELTDPFQTTNSDVDELIEFINGHDFSVYSS